MAKFPYRKEKSDLFGEVFRPIAAVGFVDNSGNELLEFAYVDSGADITLIPKSVGDLLGLSAGEDELKEVRSASGHFIKVAVKIVKVRIGRRVFKIRVGWALTEDVPLLLGRLDVFDKFKVIFDEKNKLTIFRWNKI